MAFAPRAAAELDAALEQLERDRLLVLELDDIRDLVTDPDIDPFQARRSPQQAGLDDLAGTMVAARRLPEQLTVRVVLPAGRSEQVDVPAVQLGLQRRARYLASVSWREAMAVRNMGRLQLPFGIVVSLVAAGVAYGLAYLAEQSDGGGTFALLAVLAFLSITVAWVVSWMVIETAYIDWRPASRKAAAYELLANATLEVVDERA